MVACACNARGMTTDSHTGHQALRRGRVSLSGQLYLVTTCTAARVPRFANPSAAAGTCAILRNPGTWPTVRPLVWVLMPDHWHGLLELRGIESLSVAMARMKGIVSRGFSARDNRPLWQRSFHDHALRSEEGELDVSRYVLANPVGAGLAESWRDWRWRGGDLLAEFENELTWHDG